MAKLAAITVEIEPGPTLRAALDVLELSAELLEVLPDYLARERAELESRRQALADLAITALRKGNPHAR